MPPQPTQTQSPDDAKFASLLAAHNYTPPAAPAAGASWYDKLNAQDPNAPPTFSSVGGAIGADFNKRNASIADSKANYQAGDESLGSTLLHGVGQAAGFGGDVIGEVVKSAIKPEIQQKMGEAIKSYWDTAQHSPVSIAVMNGWAHVKKNYPEVAQNLEDTGNIGLFLSNFIGVGAAKKLVGPALDTATQAAKDTATNVVQPAVDATKAAIKAPIQTAKESAVGLRNTLQVKTAEGKGIGKILGSSLSDQTKTSAGRLAEQAPLIGAGAAREAKPIDVYNSFARQEGKHLADIKEDPAISLVGSRIGDAFDAVVKQRQAAGKTMGSELATTAAKPVDLKGAFSNFQKELVDNGARYDSVNRALSAGKSSKFSTADTNILNKYASDLQTLGNKPTMKQLDAFISRIPNDIKALKATQNITFKTNAERLISNSLNDLRDALGKTGSKEYNAARAQYADLSKFINEGGSFLGKMTQSGDYAKDASIAKSAVQSVLNNGKKDWLIQLEKLTGYPAMDESTLALQAMKDAGDFKGNSLLELLTEGASGSVPVTPHGIMGKFFGGAGKLLGKAAVGSKADQTRAFLQSLEEGAGKTPKK